MTRRVDELPGVEGVALGSFVPVARRRRHSRIGPVHRRGLHAGQRRGEPARRGCASSTPGFFAVLGVPLVAGRDFNASDRTRQRAGRHRQPERRASGCFRDGDVLNRKLWWTDPLFAKAPPRRIVGVVADVDDEHVVPGPALTVYHPMQQMHVAGRLFVHASGDPYALVPPVTQLIQRDVADQPVERAATLEDVRAEVLAPERLNAFVVSGFAGVALLIAVVGVAGVLAFSVSARTREFGVRLAVGSSPRQPAAARALARAPSSSRSASPPARSGASRCSRASRRAARSPCSCRARCRCSVGGRARSSARPSSRR